MSTASGLGIAAACVVAVGAVCGGAALVDNARAPQAPLAATASAGTPLNFIQATRLAKQASFGPTVDLVNHMVALGLDGWLDEQFAARDSSYADLATSRVVPKNFCSIKPVAEQSACNRDYMSATPVAMRFYADALTGQDQLRQRVAWALSQILVASATQVGTTAGAATYNQILLDNAFGNYRDILKAVTLSPFMGEYLNLNDSNKSAPNENYARELMQLFSVSVNQLNTDGTPKKDAAGALIPTYTPTDVHEVARALTGWADTRLNGAALSDYTNIDYSVPMTGVASRYDTGAKSFLGRTVPANTAQAASVDAVIDAVFNHANTAPFIAKQLIQQLVVSNPSSDYVARVARVFADNGAGVRGDLKAVVRAILTDPEARATDAALTLGKVKEPVLFMLGVARAIGMSGDGYAFTTRDAAMGQQPFRAPSVFNFYPPDYPLPLGGELVSPTSKLMTTGTVIARHNFVYDWAIAGDPVNRSEFKPVADLPGATGVQPRWAMWDTPDVDAQIEQANLLLLGEAMTSEQRAAMKTALLALTDKDLQVQAHKRGQLAVYIAATSPLFQIDR